MNIKDKIEAWAQSHFAAALTAIENEVRDLEALLHRTGASVTDEEREVIATAKENIAQAKSQISDMSGFTEK